VKKYSLTDGFQHDMMMILDSGLFFGPPCICKTLE